jgi:hypothetical protein
MRGVLSIYERSWEIYKKEVRLIAMISTDNGDNLLQQQIRYNGKIIGNARGHCNEGWLYFCLNVRTEQNHNAANDLNVSFNLIFLLKNNFCIQDTFFIQKFFADIKIIPTP